MSKTAQLQIRVTEEQKQLLRAAANQKNMGISEYVLSRLFNQEETLFLALVEKVLTSKNHSFALAELNDFLTQLPAETFESVLRAKPTLDLKEGLFRSNYLAAMVEFAASRKGVSSPAWTVEVPPLKEPFFGSEMKSLRLHLLRNAPVAFKKRNIFIDASIGDRV